MPQIISFQIQYFHSHIEYQCPTKYYISYQKDKKKKKGKSYIKSNTTIGMKTLDKSLLCIIVTKQQAKPHHEQISIHTRIKRNAPSLK